MAEAGSASTPSYPLLHHSCPESQSPPPGRLLSSRDKVFLQLVNVYLLAQGPSQAGFLTKAHAWKPRGSLESKSLKLPPCPTWSMSSNFRAQDVDTLPGISCLIPALVPAEPRTVAPSFTTRDYPALPPSLSSQSPWSLERPKEGLIKDAEVGRKTEGF